MAAHVDSIGRSRKKAGKSREVWDNPVLWREVCTWAYGRKVAVIRLAYLFFFTMATLGLYLTLSSTTLAEASTGLGTVLPAIATPLLPFFLVSLVIWTNFENGTAEFQFIERYAWLGGGIATRGGS